MPMIEIRKLSDEIKNSYGVALMHMAMTRMHGVPQPKCILEIGCGGTLGIGIMFLLLGSEKYIAIDYKRQANEDIDEVVDGLAALIEAKAPLHEGFRIDPFFESRAIPEWIIPTRGVRAEARQIKSGVGIEYIAPYAAKDIEANSCDLVMSQVVMEHLPDLNGAYRDQHIWVKPGGYISHFIGFQSHATANEWDGHWGYVPTVWNCIKEGKDFLINREPLSAHVKVIERSGFDVVRKMCRHKMPTITREQICERYKFMSDEDRSTESALIQAKKNGQV